MKIILRPKPDKAYLSLDGRTATIEAWNRAREYRRPDGQPDNSLFLEHVQTWRKTNEKRPVYRKRAGRQASLFPEI